MKIFCQSQDFQHSRGDIAQLVVCTESARTNLIAAIQQITNASENYGVYA